MTQFNADDLAELFHADNGADAATIAGATVTGYLQDAYVETLNTTGTRPVFACASADVTAVVEGTALTIAGTSYTVAVVQPGGNGITRLVLTET